MAICQIYKNFMEENPMTKQGKKLTIAILSAIMALALIFMGLFGYSQPTAYASGAGSTPSTTYKVTQTGTISTDKWGGIALMSTSKTAIKNGDTFYIGYTVDAGTHTLSSSVLEGVLVTSNLTNRIHVDLTTGEGRGIHKGMFYSAEKDMLQAGASYLITITITEDATTAGKMSVGSSVSKTTSSGTTSYGMWEGRGSITEAGSKEYSVGLWLGMAGFTCENLAISNFYIMDANGNDLGVQNVVESGNTVDLSIQPEKCGVTFNKADGTALADLTQVVELNSQITLPQGVSNGFVCWKDASGKMYKAGDKFTVTSASTLTEVCTVVAQKQYAVVQNGDVITNKWGGFNLMNATKNTFTVGETAYMGYTVEDVVVDFTSVSSSKHGLIFTNNASTRTHTDLTIGNWYSAEAPDGKFGIQSYTTYSQNNNLLEKGATYRISIKLVEKGSAYAVETQIIKINDVGVTTINLTDYTRYFNTINKDAGLDYFFGIFLPITGETSLEYENIALTNVFIADETGADLGVTARSDVNESINLAIGEQAETINVTYKKANGEVINEYSGEKQFGAFIAENGVSNGFVCWKAGNLTYKAGDTVLSLTDIELQEVCADIALTDGASIRIGDPTGLRFRSVMEKSVCDALIATFGAENVVSGTLILPTDYLKSDVEFTIEGLNAKSVKYKNIVNDGANSVITVGNVEYYAYYASLVNILAQNLTREFSARAYLTIKLNATESITVYSDYNAEKNSRSVYEVACNMYADEDELNEINTPVLEGFINAVININGDANGYTETRPESYEESPYIITNEGNVITITAKDGFDIETVKLISINGANYVGFTADGGKIVITIA